MTVTAEAETPTESAPAVLFALPEVEKIAERPARRPTVEVPDEILTMLKEAQANNTRLYFPVRDQAHFDAMAVVLYSAGDKLGRSINAAPVKKDGAGRWVRLKSVEGATHIRVRNGERRGVKANRNAAVTE